MVEELLDRARKVADEAEVFSITYEETPVSFETNRLKRLDTRQGQSLMLRLVKDGRIGYATTSNVAAQKELVDMALEMAHIGPEACFQFPNPDGYTKVEVYDAAVEKVSVEKMVDVGQSLIAAITDRSPEILCEGGVSKESASVTIANSRGGRASYKRSTFSVYMEGTLIRGTDMLFVGDSESSCHPVLDVSQILKTVLEQLEQAKNTASVASKSMPVVLTPHGVANVLLPPLMPAFNGKVVLQGASPLGHRLGQGVFHKSLSLWDDATIPYRPASQPCDDEGVPSQRIPLVEAGVVRNFVYDLQTACKAGARSTGSGSRAGGMPAPAISALVIGEGRTSYQDMVKSMKEGLVVEQLIGAGQGNVLGGDFSGNVLLGYKVENGELVGRVKDTMISGNVYQLLKDGVTFGDRSRWVGGSLSAPHIYCQSMAVASKG